MKMQLCAGNWAQREAEEHKPFWSRARIRGVFRARDLVTSDARPEQVGGRRAFIKEKS